MTTKQTWEDELTNLAPPDLTLYLVKSYWATMIIAASTPAHAKEFLQGFINYLCDNNIIYTHHQHILLDDMPNYYDIQELQLTPKPTILYSHINPSLLTDSFLATGKNNLNLHPKEDNHE